MKSMLSYRVRLMLIGGVITIALLGTIFLQAPAPTLTVEELLDIHQIIWTKMLLYVEKSWMDQSMN